MSDERKSGTDRTRSHSPAQGDDRGSIWLAGHRTVRHPRLREGVEVDTVVVGGGITGVTTALLLQEAGQRVALLEARRVGMSNTGGSPGNLYGTLSGGLAPVRRKWGDDVSRSVAAIRMQAVDAVEAIASELGPDCSFARVPLYESVGGDKPVDLEELEAEFDALHAAGLAPRWVDDMPGLPVRVRRAFAIERQAQLNPYAYTAALAQTLADRGVRVFEESAVVDIDASEGRVETADGQVRGSHVVFATHTPIGFNLVQAEMEVYREYGISAMLASGEPPAGIFWIRDRGRSFRGHCLDGNQYLVVVGEKHKTGEWEPGVDYHHRLRDTTSAHFDVARFVHSWSAQQFKPADALPYIGLSAHDNVLIATGFAADGLTWGTVAAGLVADLVLGREHPCADLLTPRRFTPVKSAKVWATENAAVIRHLVGDRLSEAEVRKLGEVPAGEGRIVSLDGRKFAVYRAPDGALSVVSPVCPHLGCHVNWNPAEASWDCPCHGSRFDPSGAVIEGPALRALAAYESD
jgi:glycine/D-amino acid oxidase-like deaminating enzyme/nitrite reductase/ring-hydroxylating ferredoxin subunit